MVIGSNILAGASGQGGAYEIDQSIRFNDADSARLERTVSSSGSTTTWTTSVWVKRGKYTLNTNSQWFPVFSASDGSTTYDAPLWFNDVSTGGAFNVDIGGHSWRTTALARDTSAWYHVVTVWDSTAAAADRMRLYINGDRVTDFASNPTPASGANSRWNSSSYSHHRIGNLRYSGAETTFVFDGYLAEINFIDGTAVTDASDFGETNSETGQWVPKKYAGSYSGNSFYITGADSSDLGADQAGSNDFSSSGLSSADSVTDSPTDNFCTYNPLRVRGTNTLSDGNLQAAAGSTGAFVTSTFGVSSGKWYWEYSFTGTFNNAIVGVMDTTLYQDAFPSQLTRAALYYSSTGNKFIDASQSSYGATYGVSDKIGVALNLDDNEITFYKNNSSQGAISITNREYTPLVGEEGSVNGGIIANFGQTGFAYTPPTGFSALSTANLPDPTIADPSDHMDIQLWTGNDTDGRAITGYNFQPDWVWIKSRSGAYSHSITDAVRGAGPYIQSNTSDAEASGPGAFGSTLAFTSDGFTLDNGTSDNLYVNAGGETYVGWAWKANGSGSSNTDGDITSTVSANTTSGFSVLTYSGNGSDNQTIGHGLGSLAPKMIITKRRDAAGSNWTVYHDAVGINQVFYLNSTSAPTSNTEQYRAVPTSSVYTVGVGGDINNSSGTYVAYVFAEVPGFSRIGSFSGNSNADGSYVHLGFKPAFILTKNINTADQWGIRDAARNPFNVTDKLLNPNSHTAETTSSTGYIDILSTGFKARSSDSLINTQTIIYMAFAESPFKTATAR